MPSRVKVEGDLFHGVVPAGAVYVGRGAPGLKASPFMNRHRVGKPCRPCDGLIHTAAEAVLAFDDDLLADIDLLERAYQGLAGRDLACWCGLPAPGKPDICHAALLRDVVAEWVADREQRRWAAGAWAPERVQVHRPMKDVPVIGGAL
jgi:Domain of unknown function (DUF4326)